MPAATIHVRPTTELAPRVLLPGDPGRALLLAQLLLAEPKMFNHHRGLWGYTGVASDGEPLTIQATGMGGPSAAIVVEELIALGARAFLRIGTCGAIATGLELGELVVARAALARDGTSRALGADDAVAADAGLSAGLEAALAGRGASGTVVSTDLFYDPLRARHHAEWLAAGALAVEMEAAAVLRVAQLHGCAAGCLLAVSDVLVDGRRRISDHDLTEAAERLGHVALAALRA